MEPREKLVKSLKRSTLFAWIALALMFLAMFGMLVFLAVQINVAQTSIKDNETSVKDVQSQVAKELVALENAGIANHDETRQYIRCIGDVLLEPIDQRQTSDFDRCGVTGTSTSPTASSTASPTATPSAPKATAATKPVASDETTTPAPTPMPTTPPAEKKTATTTTVTDPLAHCGVDVLGLLGVICQ